MSHDLPPDWHVASVPALARFLRVAPAKLLTWIDSGELRAANIATTTASRPVWRIDRADFDRFWAARSTKRSTAGAAS